VTAVARDSALRIVTTLVPTGRRSVPVAFGWHPYLRVPGQRRSEWTLRLPSRRHLVLDDLGIPTGESHREPAESSPIARRVFDDGYALGRDRWLGLSNEVGGVALRCGSEYPFAQVWVPGGKPFAALEPMTAPTNALVDRTCPIVDPGDAFTATFTLMLHQRS
jgi:aldose 1-epimerase